MRVRPTSIPLNPENWSHMATGLDDDLLRDFFGTAAYRTIFDARQRLQAWLDVERALAEAQAELGLIPAAAAAKIATACDAADYDLDALRDEINATQHPIVPVVHALEHRVGPEAARYVHFGATTQDIMDTGAVLQLRSALDLLTVDLDATVAAAASVASAHRSTPQAGRTHAQHAVPITFGLKAATWLDELLRVRERLIEARSRMLVLQLFGAAGTMAAYGEQAFAVQAGVAKRLDLIAPPVPWHATRDRVAELGALLSLLAGAGERIADEVIRLQANEIGEIGEPLTAGHVGSSTMPQKRNPHLSEALVAKARLIHGHAATLLRNASHQHERDMSAWALEWLLVPETVILAGATTSDLRTLLEGLVVSPERMRVNLDLTGGQIAAEGLMMSLSDTLGRDQAHHLLIELTREADRQGVSFVSLARTDARITAHLDADAVDHLLDAGNHVGHSAALVDAIVAIAEGAVAPA